MVYLLLMQLALNSEIKSFGTYTSPDTCEIAAQSVIKATHMRYPNYWCVAVPN